MAKSKARAAASAMGGSTRGVGSWATVESAGRAGALAES
eukprot:CAMPEP_0172614416 /NCGR_PEP_ID=MMETSP1068-20121228/50762_1 /TAXON_ID=35684 /ORGANISM="Pseudopedinella elastica, Strain CCMP716" /LENGTH=38 /DNA_ID= /DNA_START= /DNA_END= /DNA_ORIENTATION=